MANNAGTATVSAGSQAAADVIFQAAAADGSGRDGVCALSLVNDGPGDVMIFCDGVHDDDVTNDAFLLKMDESVNFEAKVIRLVKGWVTGSNGSVRWTVTKIG